MHFPLLIVVLGAAAIPREVFPPPPDHDAFSLPPPLDQFEHDMVEHNGGKMIRDIAAYVEARTKAALICLCQHFIATKGMGPQDPNPCAEKYCAADYYKCEPQRVGELENYVVKQHNECTFNLPDFSNVANTMSYFAEVGKCLALPTEPPAPKTEAQLVPADPWMRNKAEVGRHPQWKQDRAWPRHWRHRVPEWNYDGTWVQMSA
eukprot:Gregarina_sp_Poly_1__1505@NODE_1379_length_4262_cov_262_050536_g923_i0_p2_GENE_NODE_1379_length_4262_cov_262_050536_g923_i0NODE_1379_length_4262_cov_262_050536_g923_i0_p2_ORF_typecomplete_len205_score18_19_NODE_1379_length_4262_cov_262_050536_g923_i035394153